MGELVDLSTLGSILGYCGIKSNSVSKKDAGIRKKFSHDKLQKVYELIFEHCVSQRLKSLLVKDKSALSRTPVTFILDDSIFRQWLSNMISSCGLSNCPYYGRYYSGQYHQVVWGYQVVCLGVNIGDVFYPLYLEFVRKTPQEIREMQSKHATAVALWKKKVGERKDLLANLKTSKLLAKAAKSENHTKDKECLQNALKKVNKEVKTLKLSAQKLKNPKCLPEKQEVAQKLVQKAGVFLKKLETEIKKNKENKDENKCEESSLPKFSFSCDNGYSNLELLQVCEQNGLNYISVPKKNHIITVEGEEESVASFIEKVYIPEEKAYYDEQKESDDEKKEPFMLRKRVFYKAMGREVTLLLFRLVGSKKVTAIYTANKTIFAKTLRRNWFTRTQIEQFFKLLKNYMKIKDAKSRNKASFEYHLFRFAFVGLHLQKVIRVLRQKNIIHKKASLEVLRILCSPSTFIKGLLEKLLKEKPFAD